MLLSTTPPKIKNKSSNLNSALQAVEEDYGVIPDQISCGWITVSSFAFKSVICSGSCVDDSAINAFLGLIDSEDTGKFDSLFIPQMKHALRQGLIEPLPIFFLICTALNAFLHCYIGSTSANKCKSSCFMEIIQGIEIIGVCL